MVKNPNHLTYCPTDFFPNKCKLPTVKLKMGKVQPFKYLFHKCKGALLLLIMLSIYLGLDLYCCRHVLPAMCIGNPFI